MRDAMSIAVFCFFELEPTSVAESACCFELEPAEDQVPDRAVVVHVFEDYRWGWFEPEEAGHKSVLHEDDD